MDWDEFANTTEGKDTSPSDRFEVQVDSVEVTVQERPTGYSGKARVVLSLAPFPEVEPAQFMLEWWLEADLDYDTREFEFTPVPAQAVPARYGDEIQELGQFMTWLLVQPGMAEDTAKNAGYGSADELAKDWGFDAGEIAGKG